MLRLNSLIGFGARPRRDLIRVQDMGTLQDTGTLATGTFPFADYGGLLSSTRTMLAGFALMDSAATFAVSGVTINGNAAAVTHINVNQTIAGIASVVDEASASGDVVVTCDEAIAQDKLCALLNINGASTGHSSSSNSNAAGTSISIVMDDASFAVENVLVVVSACKRASAQAFASIVDDSVSLNPWINVENLAASDGGARLGMWYKLFEKPQAGIGDITVTVTGGATVTEYTICYRVFNPPHIPA